MRELPFITILFTAILSLVGNSLAGPSPADSLFSILPQDGEIAGWLRDGEPVLCLDEACLAQYLNGAAPYYLERGMAAVLFQYYQHRESGGEIKVEAYRMAGASSAQALFLDLVKSRPRGGELEGMEAIGEDRRMEQALMGVHLLEFHQGYYFVRMEAAGKGPPIKESLLRFGMFASVVIRGSVLQGQ